MRLPKVQFNVLYNYTSACLCRLKRGSSKYKAAQTRLRSVSCHWAFATS